MESFNKHLRKTRTEWFALPLNERVEAISSLVRMDSDAVVRIKMAGKECVRKGKYTEKFLGDFYELVDDWLSEISSGEKGIEVYKKVAAITYAREMVM